MNDEDLEVIKELSEVEDCSIHWFSKYNIALERAYKILKKLKEQ